MSMREWGRRLGAELDRVVVVSPHFDDAVLGCGHLLAAHPGSAVVTVMGGRPPAYPDPVSPWDAWGGFGAGDDVVAARRLEDEAALAVLGADHAWLDFADFQYLEPGTYTPEQVAEPLEAAIVGCAPAAVFFPFGLANPDHVLTHDATRLVRDRHPELAWFCYEDQGYKHIPGMLAWRVSSLFRAGLWPTPAVVGIVTDPEPKRRALACYASQIPALENDWAIDDALDAPVPEQYWRLAPPPPGWEGLR
jgi:LmbE family N-acetylglucosaminyl deacetylase